MSIKTIYDDLRRAGMSHAGAVGMLCNMQGESSMRSNNAQDALQKCSDEEYTVLFDKHPDACINDSVGYGLCQWTWAPRKRNLWQFAQNWGVSVSAEDMQTAFAIYELKTEYANLWSFLRMTTDTYTATKRICEEFERPEVCNVKERYAYAPLIENAVNLYPVEDYEEESTEPTLEDIADMLVAIAEKLRGISY